MMSPRNGKHAQPEANDAAFAAALGARRPEYVAWYVIDAALELLEGFSREALDELFTMLAGEELSDDA
jgi:hypothetical protein